MFGLASTIASGAMNAAMAGLQMANENQNIEKQNQFNIDMWKMQNEYNSPQAQMRRLSDAGLNPNLMYGMGNVGNATSAPDKKAPDYSKSIDYLSKAFNIQNLAKGFQELRQHKALADIAEVNAQREFDHYQADKDFGQRYDYDVNTGKFVEHDYGSDGNYNVPVYAYPAQRYYRLKHAEENFVRTHLLVPRERNINENTNAIPTRKALWDTQRLLLAPQVTMQNYNSRYYPWSFWIGNGTKLFNSLSSGIPALFY